MAHVSLTLGGGSRDPCPVSALLLLKQILVWVSLLVHSQCDIKLLFSLLVFWSVSVGQTHSALKK